MNMNNMNNNNNNNDCGCDGNSIDILTNNNNGNNMNGQIVNNVRQGNNNNKYINTMAQNQQNINNNPVLNSMIVEPPKPVEINNNVERDTGCCKKELRFFLYILLALSINEMLKFFINQSIRLNKASSSRYLFYPIVILVILALVCLC